MNVSDMLDLMGTLGIGESTAVEDSNDIFLQYLNLANCELYNDTAALNTDIFLNENLNNIAGENSIQVLQEPFLIAEIFPIGQVIPLIGLNAIPYATYVLRNPNPSSAPTVYARQKKTIYFYPYQPGTVYDFSVWYVPQPATLTENTTEDEIPYPISYQQVLVDGALYYLFQDESGFKNSQKEQAAERRWKAGKTNLISYLRGAHSNKISTFSNV